MKRRWSLLLILLALDLACVGLHVAQSAGWLHSKMFRLDRDRGWAERYQYLQAVVAAVLLWRRGGGGPTLLRVWAVLFLYLAADDAFRLHERVGGVWLGGKLGVDHGYDYGQVIFAGALASALALSLWIGWRRADAAARRTCWGLVAAVALLGAAGVGVDFASAMLNPDRFQEALVVLEDGGELVAMSLAVWVAIGKPPSGDRVT